MTDLADGIYFGLDEAEYHALPRLSGSGTQNLMISPATYWADSYLNPARDQEEEDPELVAKKAKALIMGSAYHKARLEPAMFTQIYYRGLRLRDYPNALSNHTQIKEQLKALGQPVGTDKVEEAARRLRAAGYPGPIKHLLESELQADKEDWQIQLPWKSYDQIVADMQALESNTDILPLLREGESEVSILWTDDKGVKWKARLDRLQEKRITDFKTFDNSRGKLLEQALYDAVQYNRYHLQARVYWEAAEMIRAGKLKICKVQRQEQKDLIAAIRESQDPFEYWWVFQEKNGIPNVLARRLVMTEEPHPSHLYQAPDEKSRKALAAKLRSPSIVWKKAELEVRAMRDLFIRCSEIWPDQPWGSLRPVEDMTDEGFNQRWLEE